MSESRQPHWAVPVVAGALVALLIAWLGLNDWRFPFVAQGNQSGSDGSSSSGAAAPSSEVRAIDLPSEVFGFHRIDHETRQSHTLDVDQAGEGAYSYAYWENDEGIWLDATAVAGDEGISSFKRIKADQVEQGQRSKKFGSVTCVWQQDADPNTPRHSVWCFILGGKPQIALITSTHTQGVGEISAANLTSEIWRQIRVSQS